MSPDAPRKVENEFLDAASQKRERGIVGEFIGFMRENKAWWLTPILVVLGLVGVLVAAAGSGALAWVYTLF